MLLQGLFSAIFGGVGSGLGGLVGGIMMQELGGQMLFASCAVIILIGWAIGVCADVLISTHTKTSPATKTVE